jgi:phosphoribosylformimino-5-aminoimidazole carboxamide ribotide isomerase
VQGKLDKKVYSRDPLKTAKHWVKQGAKVLHVVDLDGAFTGEQKNLGLVKQIALNVSVPVQLGGGVRDIKTIKKALEFGVWRVVLGTKAVEDKEFLKKSFKEFKEKIIVSIDAKEGVVLTKGWQASHKGKDALKFGSSLKDIGFKEVIYTDILKDGTLSGPNIMAIKSMIRETGLKIIASGGISCLEDIEKLKRLEKQGVTGVIVGKALYEGRFSLKAILKKRRSNGKENSFVFAVGCFHCFIKRVRNLS